LSQNPKLGCKNTHNLLYTNVNGQTISLSRQFMVATIQTKNHRFFGRIVYLPILMGFVLVQF